MDITIRKETRADIEAIAEVTKVAFTNVPVSRLTEPYIIRELRKAGAMSLSLVAEVEGKVIGHIAFSPIEITDGTKDWYGLGPVSVLPELQKQGIGKALIHIGIAMLKEKGAKGIALVGEPSYYNKFGFKNYPQLIHKGISQDYFLIMPLSDEIPQGTVNFHEAFLAEE